MRKAAELLVIVAVATFGLAAPPFAPAYAFSRYEPGTIVDQTSERRLYYVLNNGRA